MTTSTTEVHNGTVGNDTFNASVTNSLQTGDIILDASTADNDTINATVTINSAAPRVQNVETINITGLYVTSGLDLANVSGTTDLNINSTIVNGTATVTNASTLNAVNINAGSNIATVAVTATASGTRDTVNIDSGSATLTTVNAGAGTDLFAVTTTGNVTVTGGAAVDTVTLNLSDATTTITGDTTLGKMIINQTGVNGVITVGGALTATQATGVLTTVNSDQNVTIKSVLANITGTAMATTGAGTVTVQITNDANAADLVDIQADVINLAAATTGSTIVTNADSQVKLSADMASAMVFNQSNLTGATAIGTTGTLVMEIAKTQTVTTTTGAAVGTLLLSAGVDATAAVGAQITVADLQLGAATNTAVISGAENLVLTKLTMDTTTADVVTASSMTGNLTVAQTVGTADQTIVLGQGNDSLGATSVGIALMTVYGGAGNDTIAIAASKLDSTVYGDEGNDTITGGALGSKLYGGAGNDTINNKLTYTSGATTVDGGAGDDIVNMLTAGGVNTVTLGDGADQLRLDANAAQANTHTVTVTDFVKGTDTLVLTGTADAGVNLTTITPAAGVYGFSGAAGDYVVTLTGNTATDMSDSVQLGVNGSEIAYTGITIASTAAARNTKAISNAFAALDGTTVVAGSKADTITVVTDKKATITLGTGADKFIVVAGTGTNETGTSTITDFNIAEDVIILAGTAGVAIDLTAVQTAGSVNFGTDVFKTLLTNVTATSAKAFVQLGTEDIVFTAKEGVATKGGDLADYVLIADAGTTSFTGGKGADVVTITDVDASEIATINIAAGDSLTTAWDKVYGFSTVVTTGDKLNLDSQNIASVVGTTAVGSITGVTVANGVITAWAGIENTINASTLSDAIAFLATNVGGTDTIAFHYAQDLNADGDVGDLNETSTFVFQNGATDTLVELVGVTAAATAALGVSGTPVANTIELA
ncbi:hypothetical protein [Sulfurimonas sp.]|uniref:beta strand repeat-containing protein n=1 Tax=Sulfurimonas sp. TaxID=2022749 RepID=UPI00262445AA|nr:hypothetical protein [Sulfurimonas sp.]MDD3855973.1 hypothetical protein [Sulfurimonas sp.]